MQAAVLFCHHSSRSHRLRMNANKGSARNNQETANEHQADANSKSSHLEGASIPAETIFEKLLQLLRHSNIFIQCCDLRYLLELQFCMLLFAVVLMVADATYTDVHYFSDDDVMTDVKNNAHLCM